jgi:ABC-type nitrate/sulfonate/bicarbonate transport system substrate-binding protein
VTRSPVPAGPRPPTLGGLLLLLVLLGACGGGGGGAAPPTRGAVQVSAPLEPVRVLYAAPSAALLPYWAGDAAGAFVRNGLRVELTAAPDAAAAYARLLKGEVEVYLTPLTPELVAQAAEGADLAILGGTPELAIVTTRRQLGSREVIYERFLRGVLEGIAVVQKRPELGRELLASQAGLTAPAQADEALQAYLRQGGAERVPYLPRTEIEAALGQAPANAAQPLDADRLLEHSLLRRLEASGYVDGLYRA